MSRYSCEEKKINSRHGQTAAWSWRWWQVQHLRAHLIVFLCQHMMPSFVEALAPAAAADDPPPMVQTLERLSERLARLCPRENEPERVVDMRLSMDERAALRRMGRVLSARYLAERPSAQRRLALFSLASCRQLLACPVPLAGDVPTNSRQGVSEAIRASRSETVKASMGTQAGEEHEGWSGN